MCLRVEFVTLIALTALLYSECVQASVKKGGAVGPRDFLCDDLKVMDNINWWYDWGFNLFEISELSGCKNLDQYKNSFIPMIWGRDFHKNATIYKQTQFLLGFNEPNHMEQSNLTAEQAADIWPEVEKIGRGKMLVSPSASGCGGPNCHGDATEWFDDFFRFCNGCRIDYIATHAYHCNADATLDYLKSIYDRYGKEIWLTEFACPKTTDPKKELEYMKAILPRLEAAPYIFRYSWFVFRTRSSTGFVTQAASLLQQNVSELTALGQFYNAYTHEESSSVGDFVSKVFLVFHYMFMALKKIIF